MARDRDPSRRAAPKAPPSRPFSRAAPWLALCAILLGVALAYRPALRGPFVLDDWGGIEANTALRAPRTIRIPSVPELLGPGRVLTEITFAIDWRAARLDPFRFHVVGLGLHLAAVVAAFTFLSGLLRRSGHARPRGVALVVAGLFAVHPIQVESVAYAVQRAEVLSSLLYLVTLVLLDRAARQWPGWRGALGWAGGALTWLGAMGAKTIAISAPGVFVLDQAVVAPEGDRGWAGLRRRVGRAVLLSAPLLALASWSALLHLRSFDAAPGSRAGFGRTPLGAVDYLFTQLRVQWLYLRLLAWPDDLAFDRTFTASTRLDGPVVLAGAGVVACLALAGWLWWRAGRTGGPRPAERLAAFGILFWFAVLSPTSSFVPVADLAVEHRVYLACIGPFLALVVAGDALIHRMLLRPRAAAAGVLLSAALFLLLGLALRSRTRLWSSEETLWESSARASPGNARAWTNLGLARSHRGDRAGAEAAYRRAWTVLGDPALTAGLARNHGSLLTDLGRASEALGVLERGLALEPDDPSLHANRAAALGQLGRRAEALSEARRAVALAPGDPLMHNVLGQALAVNGDWRGALAEFRTSEGLDPGNPAFAAGAGISLAALGRRDESCAAFRRARALSGSRTVPLDAARYASGLGCPLEGP